MIDKNDISSILCRCGSCADCDTTDFETFRYLIEGNGEDFINQQRLEFIEGALIRHRAQFPFSAEAIVEFMTYLDRAFEMAQRPIDFHCKRVEAIINDVPDDIPYIGFVQIRLANRDVYPEVKPYKPRRRSKPVALFSWSSSLFEFSEVFGSTQPPKTLKKLSSGSKKG